MKLMKILWNDFRDTDIASLSFEALKVLVFTLFIGIVAYFTSVIFGVLDLVSLTFFGWFIVFLILGCVVIVGFGAAIIALYILAFIASAFYDAFTKLPKYINSVRNRMHE